MKIYAISDLHLSLDGNKPMDIFGNAWDGYVDKIKEDWNNKVNDDDIVLISGDISWGMELNEAVKDFVFFDGLKGTKILIRGNHDYWWNGIGKVRKVLPPNIIALQNDSVKIGKYVICGSRGWAVPGSPDYDEHDEKIYKREVERFKMSLESGKKLLEEGDELIAMIHYPPFSVSMKPTLFTDLFEKYNVNKVIYGHLHGNKVKSYKRISINGIEYVLTSCDLVDNTLVEIY